MKATSNNNIRFILISTVVALSLLGDAMLYVVLPARPEDFHVLIWQVGILLGANRFIRLITNELAGRIVDRFSSEKPLLLAVLVGGLTTASYAISWGFWWLLAARMTWGACWSVLRVEGYLSALTLSHGENRGKIIAIYQALSRLGSGGGTLLGGLLTDLVGLRFTFFLFSIITISGVILVLKAKPDEVPVTDPSNENQKIKNPEPLEVFNPFSLWFCVFSLAMTEQMIANLTGRLVADRIALGIPFSIGVASLTGILLSFRTFGTLFIGPVSGILSDRIGREKLILLTTLLQIIAISLLVLSKNWLLGALVLSIQLLASSASRVGIYVLAGDKAPQEGQALFMNRFSTFNDLGTALGPFVTFSIYAYFGFGWVAVLAIILLSGIIGKIVKGL